jgi:Fic family protein
VEQAKDTLNRYDKLISLHQKFHEVIATSAGSIRLAAIVDELFYLPVAVVARIAERQDVSYPTARSDLIKLDQMGILTEATEVPQLTYYCLPILDIIYAD